MKKRVVINLPKGQSGLQVKMNHLRAGLGFNSNVMPWPIMAGKMSEPNIQVNSTLSPVPRDEANLEAEKGEVAALPTKSGIPDTYKIGGKRHYEGGTPLNLPKDSFIYSDTPKMRIKDKVVLAQFGMPERKSGYTPAEIAKKYDVAPFKKILVDKNTDKLQKETAELMIANYNLKLAKLALVQESMKGFPQGIPLVAMPYIESMQIDPAEFVQMNPGQGDAGAQQEEAGSTMAYGGDVDYFAQGGMPRYDNGGGKKTLSNAEVAKWDNSEFRWDSRSPEFEKLSPDDKMRVANFQKQEYDKEYAKNIGGRYADDSKTAAFVHEQMEPYYVDPYSFAQADAHMIHKNISDKEKYNKNLQNYVNTVNNQIKEIEVLKTSDPKLYYGLLPTLQKLYTVRQDAAKNNETYKDDPLYTAKGLDNVNIQNYKAPSVKPVAAKIAVTKPAALTLAQQVANAKVKPEVSMSEDEKNYYAAMQDAQQQQSQSSSYNALADQYAKVQERLKAGDVASSWVDALPFTNNSAEKETDKFYKMATAYGYNPANLERVLSGQSKFKDYDSLKGYKSEAEYQAHLLDPDSPEKRANNQAWLLSHPDQIKVQPKGPPAIQKSAEELEAEKKVSGNAASTAGYEDVSDMSLTQAEIDKYKAAGEKFIINGTKYN